MSITAKHNLCNLSEVNNKSASLSNDQLTSGSNIPCSGGAPITIPNDSAEEGVSPKYVQNSAIPIDPDKVWFYMRVAYGQEKKVRDYLIAEGIEVFLPTIKKERVMDGIKKQIEVSLIPNSLFVHSTETNMKRYVGKFPTNNLHHFYEPYHDEKGQPIGSGRKPVIVPDSQMQSFQIWTSSSNENKIFIDKTDFEFKNNDLVRITEGEFKGFSGYVVRLKGQTRVAVIIESVGFISTTYVPKKILELITI